MEHRYAGRPAPKNHKRKIIIAVIMLVVIGAGAFVFMWATSSSKAVVTDAPARQRVGPTSKAFPGTNITFRYSSIYEPKNATKGDNDKESYIFTANTNYDKHIAVAVSTPIGGQLDNFSPYIARKTRTDLYERQDLRVAGEPAILFIKNDNTERTVFVPHNGMVATLAFVTGGAFDELQTEIDQLLTTFSWKQ